MTQEIASTGKRRSWPRFRARTRLIWRRTLSLAGPFALTALLLWAIGLAFGSRVSFELLIISIASFVALGTTVILTPALVTSEITLPLINYTVEIHLGTWDIALWMMYLNTAAAYLYAYNLDLLEKLPWVGTYLKRARANAGASLDKHRWIRRMAEFGIVLFVISPLPGSGQLGGCFIGRVLGLTKRNVFLVVTLAGVGVAAAYALFGAYIKQVFDDAQIGPWVRVAMFVAVLMMAWFIFKLLRFLGREPETAEGGDAQD